MRLRCRQTFADLWTSYPHQSDHHYLHDLCASPTVAHPSSVIDLVRFMTVCSECAACHGVMGGVHGGVHWSPGVQGGRLAGLNNYSVQLCPNCAVKIQKFGNVQLKRRNCALN